MSTHDATDFEVVHPDPLRRVEIALEDLRAGKMIILTDDEDRENEGDLVIAAECITPEAINFMATHARGLICLAMTGAQVDKLGLPMMATNNQSAYNTAFTVSIEAREGVSTGISAADRAHTVLTAISRSATPRSVVAPGHMFPLRARDGGVLVRVGQTEGSVDLARLAKLDPSAVICEIMNPDGTMARVPDLEAFGRRHSLHMCSVADIIKFRMQRERVVARESGGTLEVPGLGTWNTRLYRGVSTDSLHLALWVGDLDDATTLARVQAAPPPWSMFNADASSLAASARAAMEQIHAVGRGAVVLMHLGGASTDVLLRTFERDVLGASPPAIQARADALRDLGAGCQILRDLGLERLRLLLNNSRPILGVESYGLRVEERLPLFGDDA